MKLEIKIFVTRECCLCEWRSWLTLDYVLCHTNIGKTLYIWNGEFSIFLAGLLHPCVKVRKKKLGIFSPTLIYNVAHFQNGLRRDPGV